MAKTKKTTTEEQRYAEVSAKIEVLEQELLATQEENAELRKKLSSLSNASPTARSLNIAPAPTVTIDSKTWRVVSGIQYEGEKYTREDLAKNKELCKQLIAAGSTALVEK